MLITFPCRLSYPFYSHLELQITMLLIRGMQYDVYIFLCPTGLVQCHFHQQLLLSNVLAQGW